MAGALAWAGYVANAEQNEASLDAIHLYARLSTTFIVFWALAGIALELRIVRRRPGPVFWLWVVAGVATAVLRWASPALDEPFHLRLFVVLATLEMLRLAVFAVRQSLPDAWVVGGGLGLLTLGVGSDVVDDLFALRLINTDLPYYAGLCAARYGASVGSD